jgi:hypothetical protein
MTIDGRFRAGISACQTAQFKPTDRPAPLRFRIGRLEILGKGFRSFAKQDFAAIIFTWADDTQ